jgi:hypothetical protein
MNVRYAALATKAALRPFTTGNARFWKMPPEALPHSAPQRAM